MPFQFSSFESRAARSAHPACQSGGPPPPAAPPRRSWWVRSVASRLLASKPTCLQAPHSASPVRALGASVISPFASLLGRVVAPPASHARSTRRGTPRPCCSAMPRAGISSVPRGFVVSMAIDDTARVRRPTLTTLPSATHPRSHLTLPTAPNDRSRPHNPACSGLRGAARRSPLTHVG